MRSSKKMTMTPTDHINQQAVASYVRGAIWPRNKMLPKSWSKWRDDKRSLCQMILKKGCITSGCGWKVILEAIILVVRVALIKSSKIIYWFFFQ